MKPFICNLGDIIGRVEIVATKTFENLPRATQNERLFRVVEIRREHFSDFKIPGIYHDVTIYRIQALIGGEPMKMREWELEAWMVARSREEQVAERLMQ